MSPPPRPELEDYFARKLHRGAKKRRAPKKKQRRSPFVRSEDTESTERSPAPNPTPQSLGSRNCMTCELRRNRGVIGHTANPPPSLHTISSQASNREPPHQANRMVLSPVPKAKFAVAALQDLEETEKSSAVNSLRRVSQSFTQNRESNLRDLRHLSRTLTNKLSQVFASKDRDHEPYSAAESTENTPASNKRRAATMSNITYQDEIRPLLRPSVMDNLPETLSTPGSITLRKASNAVVPRDVTNIGDTSSVHRGLSAAHSFSRRQSLAQKLIAFRSRRVNEAPLLNNINLSPPHQEDLTATLTNPSDESQGNSLGATKSVDHLNISIPYQRRISVADAALTFADFYPAPGTFVKPNSGTDPIIPEKAPYNFSIMRVLTYTAAHEIIWREDETPSTSSSSSLVTPAGSHLLSPTQISAFGSDSTRENDLESNIFPASMSPDEYKPPSQVHHSDSDVSAVDSAKDQNSFFTWAWENTDLELPSDERPAPPNPTRSRSTTNRTDKATAELRQNSLPAVQSFPLLSSQRSSSDLRNEPADDEFSNRAPEQKAGNSDAELDRGLAMFMRRSPKLAGSQSQPSTVGKMGMGGKESIAENSSNVNSR